MAKRIIIKPGDIFCIELEGDRKCYFQNIGKDTEQLYSDVICVFKKKYEKKEEPTIEEIISDEVYFYSHIYIRWWVKEGFWTKIGNGPINKRINNLYFKTFSIEDDWIEWRIWKVNHRERFYKNALSKKLFEKCEWGSAFPAMDIIRKITNGYFAEYMHKIDIEYQNKPDKIGIFDFLRFRKK